MDHPRTGLLVEALAEHYCNPRHKPLPQSSSIDRATTDRQAVTSMSTESTGHHALSQSRNDNDNDNASRRETPEDEEEVLDLPADIKTMIYQVKRQLFNSYTEIQRLEALMLSCGERLSRGNLADKAINAMPAAVVRRQTDELQRVWEHLSTLEKMYNSAVYEIATVKAKLA